MNIIDVIQGEIQRHSKKPVGKKIVPTRTSNHIARGDSGQKPDRVFSAEVKWLVQTYIYDRGGEYTPVIEDFGSQIYPPPQTDSDGFNSTNYWVVESKRGKIVDRYFPQYTNRRYSTIISTENSNGREPIRVILRWNKNWKVLCTDSSGVEIAYTPPNDIIDTEHTFYLPIHSGQTRIDVLLYTNDSDAGEFGFYIDTSDVFNNRTPIPIMRMATVEQTILVNGDGSWHDHLGSISYVPTGATITFQDNSETTTVTFNDNSDVPGADTIVRDSGSWSEFSNGDTIVVTGTVHNDGTYTINTVSGSIITLVSGDKLQDETSVANTTIRTNSEITDSASGMSSISNGDIVSITGTTNNNTYYVVETATASTLTLDIRSIVTDEANVQATISIYSDTHHGTDEGLNFQVRDVMLIKRVIDLRPDDILTNASTGHEHDTLDLGLTDDTINGSTDTGSAHSHGSTTLSITGSTAAGDAHNHSISSSGTHDHSGEVTAGGDHSHGGSTGSESTHEHGVGTLDISGNTNNESSHTHAVGSLAIVDSTIIGGTKTGKDTISIPGSEIVDETDSNLVEVEVMRDGNGFISPAQRAEFTGAVTFNQISYTATGITYTEIVNEANTISFNNTNPDTIVDSASGFGSFTNGMTIRVTGTRYNDGDYTIATATAGTLTLVASDSLTDEDTGYTCKVHGESTITKSGANFDTQGFEAGMIVRVSDTTSNDGDYLLAGVSANQLDLSPYEELTTETVSGSSTIKGQPTITDTGNGFLTAGLESNMPITISNAIDPNNNGTHQIDTATAGKLTLSLDDVLADRVGDTVTIVSIDKMGFSVRYKVASGKKYKIHYTALAWGFSQDEPYSDNVP